MRKTVSSRRCALVCAVTATGYDRFHGDGTEQRLMRNGLTIGGVIVIIGIVVAIFWSLLWGIIIALVGLLAFGGFTRGRWY